MVFKESVTIFKVIFLIVQKITLKLRKTSKPIVFYGRKTLKSGVQKLRLL